MARDEADREDLLREAGGLSRRAEFSFAERNETVFAGFKRDGSLSIYFGANAVYQFNPEGQLRRAYADEFLYRTQGHTLARLERSRTETETILARYDLTQDELREFLRRMRSELEDLRQRLSGRSFDGVKQVPGDADLVSAILAAIESTLSAESALAPAIPGRK